MKTAILLTSVELNEERTELIESPVIIGVKNIITIKERSMGSYKNNLKFPCTEIRSTAAMVTSTYVKESIAEIWQQINS